MMPTAAQRAEAAAAAKATTEGGGGEAPSSKVDPDADLEGMSLTELRTEAKRLTGADYDHGMDQDRDGLMALARTMREDRRAYYAQQRKAQREAALAAMSED